MHYLDEGASDEAFLMVHGNPTWSFYWRNLVAAWRDRFRVVVPDHLGCGLSDKPQRYPYSLQQHTANLVELIESLDLRNITLFAHDWGGAIGLNAARACPERFKRFVLFNTGAFPPPRVPRRIAVCRTPLLGTIALRGLNLFARSAQRMATCRRPGLDPEVLAGLIAPYDSWANRVAIDAFVRDIPLTRRHPTYIELEKLESFLYDVPRKPTQLIWGMRDWCFDKTCLERLQGIFPDAAVHRIQDAGHWVVEDAPDQIIDAVNDFLAAAPACLKQADSVEGQASPARGPQ
jgi:haloalkane dehalogenase